MVEDSNPLDIKHSRIGEHSIWAEFGSGRYEGSRDVIWPENVKDSLAGGDPIIWNDPPVTPPPLRLCAHDGAPLGMTEFTQFLQRGVKVLAHRVVGVIVKTLVLPERIRGDGTRGCRPRRPPNSATCS
jgi:hypothetical protein